MKVVCNTSPLILLAKIHRLGLLAQLYGLDDQQGRHVAREQGLPVTGTVGILIEAQERRMIPSVRHELDHLIEAGMWIDEAFYHRILQEFGE